jgi:hypothetical protein
MPFFNKIKIPKLIELERSVAAAKNELEEFKGQTNNMFSILSTSINTINSNTTNIIMPNRDELIAANKEFDQSVEEERPEAIRVIEEQLILDDEDRIVALARLRIKLEYLLRELLLHIAVDKGKRENELRRLSLPSLFKEFRAHSSGYEHLEKSLYYVTQICNAAIHSQLISPGQADEALELGAKILAYLPKISKKNKAQQPH